MLDSEFRFKIGIKNYFIGLVSIQYSFFKFIITIFKINFTVRYFLVNLYEYIRLIPLIYTLSIKNLSSTDFNDSDIKYISKLMNKINYEIKKNELKIGRDVYLILSGWKYIKFSDIKIYDSKHFEIKNIVKQNITRQDVVSVHGKKFKKSGFQIIINLENGRTIDHIVGLHDKDSKESLFDKTKNVYIKNECFICYKKTNIGFIDDIKAYFIEPKFNKAKILSNLIQFNPYFFSKLAKVISKSEFYNLFIDFYLSTNYINNINLHLLNIDKFNKNHLALFNKNDLNIELLKYSINNSYSTNIFEYSDVKLVHGKFLIKNKTLLNTFDNFLNYSLIAGENNLLLQDQSQNLTTGIITKKDIQKKFVDEAIILPSLAPNNYFHFLLENCIGLWHNINKLDTCIPILLPENIHKNLIEILQIIGFKNFIFINSDNVITINKVYTFNKSTNIVDALERNLNSFSLNIEMTRIFAEFILSKLNEQNGKLGNKNKFFVSRFSNNKSLVNQDLLANIASNHGYTLANPEKLSFMEQVELFNTASNLIVVGGASMANLIFKNRGSRLLFLCNVLQKRYRLVDELVSVQGGSVNYLFGKNKVSILRNVFSAYDFFHSDYSVSKVSFIKYLQS